MHRLVTKEDILNCSVKAKEVLEIVKVLKLNDIYVSELDTCFENNEKVEDNYLILSPCSCYHIYKNEKFAENDCASIAMLTLDGNFYIKPGFEKAAHELKIPIEFHIDYPYYKEKDEELKFVNIIHELWDKTCGDLNKLTDFFLAVYKKEEKIITEYNNKIQTIKKTLFR